jgi:hypothetical protein
MFRLRLAKFHEAIVQSQPNPATVVMEFDVTIGAGFFFKDSKNSRTPVAAVSTHWLPPSYRKAPGPLDVEYSQAFPADCCAAAVRSPPQDETAARPTPALSTSLLVVTIYPWFAVKD